MDYSLFPLLLTLPGLDTFKAFLSSIQKNEDASDKAIQLQVLKQYCDDQSASNEDENDLSDLISTWSFAVQSNHDSVLSAVPAVFAQLFRLISNDTDFREFGRSLCQTLLKRDQVRLFDMGLSAPKFKEHLISPCLRLLTEIVGFDDGSAASTVFSRRDVLLRRLDALLDTTPTNQDTSDRRNPTVRRNAQRLLLSLLKYLDIDPKSELIGQGKALHACLRKISSDGGDIVQDQLSYFRQYIIYTKLPKQVKTRFLNSSNLNFFASLYDFEEDIEDASNTQAVRNAAHNFLLNVCTQRDTLLLPQSGWYPLGSDTNTNIYDDGGIDLGLDSPYWFDEYKTSVPVKNTTLSTFLQTRRPDKDALQSGLIVRVFEAAPELVADYFAKKPKSTITPKDEGLWRNYFAFIFSVITLPTPVNCGWQSIKPTMPPPLSVVIESILPRPLSRSLLSTCLKSDDVINVLSAARLLVAVLSKLKQVRQALMTVSASGSTGSQTCVKLNDLVLLRIPSYQDLVTALQKTSSDQSVRTALLESMACYNAVLPSSTAGSKFDVGPAISACTRRLLSPDSPDDAALYSSQMISLIRMASRSANVKWWHKSDPNQLSPFLSLLRTFAASKSLRSDVEVSHFVASFLERNGLVISNGSSAEALLDSFHTHDASFGPLTWLFAENCMTRVSKQPVKYYDQLETLRETTSGTTSASLFAICAAEQWPFAVKANDSDDISEIGNWLATLFAYLKKAGENEQILIRLRQQILQHIVEKDYSASVSKSFKEAERLSKAIVPHTNTTAVVNDRTEEHEDASTTVQLDLSEVFSRHATPTSLDGLTNWSKPGFESELASPIASSRLARLITCLSSLNGKIRSQAQKTIQTVAEAMSASTYSEKDQVGLLLGEILETSRQHDIASDQTLCALPSIITQLSIFLLAILVDPSDKMYSKANRFVMRGPHWSPLTRVLPYWIDQTFFHEPESDEPFSWDFEVDRMLDLLIAGLRVPQDLDLYRKSSIFERIESLYFSPALAGRGRGEGMRKKILHVLHSALETPGGSDMLMTRVGQDAWLSIVSAHEGEGSEMGQIVKALQTKMKDGCSQDYIKSWEQDRPLFRQTRGVQ